MLLLAQNAALKATALEQILNTYKTVGGFFDATYDPVILVCFAHLI